VRFLTRLLCFSALTGCDIGLRIQSAASAMNNKRQHYYPFPLELQSMFWPIRVASVEVEKPVECTEYGYITQMLTTTAITRLGGNGQPSWGDVGGEARYITGVPKVSNTQRRETGGAMVER